MKLGNFKVLTFDCYGTLIDWESGIWNAFQPLLREQSTAIEASDLLLRFAHHEFEAEQTNPDLLYPALLARVHQNISDELGVETSSSMNENGHGVVVGRMGPQVIPHIEDLSLLKLVEREPRLQYLALIRCADGQVGECRLAICLDRFAEFGSAGLLQRRQNFLVQFWVLHRSRF
tara:strand:- start:310 stop:834 length:525 start_codon:yes stop_codon:yes gene_type:complete